MRFLLGWKGNLMTRAKFDPAFKVGDVHGHLLILDAGEPNTKQAARVLRVRCIRCGAESARPEKNVIFCARRGASSCDKCTSRRAEAIARENEVLDAIRGGARGRCDIDRATGRRYHLMTLSRIIDRLVVAGRVHKLSGTRGAVYEIAEGDDGTNE